ncbi:IPT/TIG domain-containing protein [Ferruginibacter albus]|uniref:IPT/TIG domain-containing protein n=1 Tax=Ferruginibacter albus TaxID=2875540 RepID=UPI001CC65BC3|nr:IPT/TIG domain-containing protein [Ferruginibacter albus]UAY51870.1 IPT/TIG domain-containing protein [Ferruginibacter albus]
MKKILLAGLSVFFMAVFAMVSCSKSDSPSAPAPTVTTISPSSASVGQTITITGTNLSSATVTIGGKSATVSSPSATSIVVTIPSGVATGAQTVVVTTSGGSVSKTVTIVDATPTTPTIAAIAPTSVSAGGTITITGTNLSGATVTIGGKTATVTSTSATSLTVTVPSDLTTGAQTVIVTTGAGSVSNTLTIAAPLPASSNDVASDRLAAYWPFRTDSKETVSSTSAEKTGGTVTYGGSGGPFGAYANFSTGYLIYPTISNLNQQNSLDQYSISMWVKIANSNATTYPATGGRYTSLFGVASLQVGGQYGPYQLTLHTNDNPATDVFEFGSVIRQIDGRNIQYGDYQGLSTDHLDDSSRFSATVAGAGDGSKWIHVVQTFFGYTPNPRPMSTYVNGVKLDDHLYYNLIASGENIDTKPGAGDVKVTFGTFHFSDDFGASSPWGGPTGTPDAASSIYWAHGITAGMSDVRFFKAPLSDEEVGQLYQLGLQGK